MSPQPPPMPAYESREAQKPVEAFVALAPALWPRLVPESILAPDSMTTKARMPPPRLSLMRKPRRELESNTRMRLSRSPVPEVDPVAFQLPKLRFARP